MIKGKYVCWKSFFISNPIGTNACLNIFFCDKHSNRGFQLPCLWFAFLLFAKSIFISHKRQELNFKLFYFFNYLLSLVLGVIDVKFNSKGKKGKQNKRVTLTTNMIPSQHDYTKEKIYCGKRIWINWVKIRSR